MHIMQETLRKDCRTACECSLGIDGKHRTRRGKWFQQPCSILNIVALAVHRGELESYLTLPSLARTVCRLVALNSLPLGVLKMNLMRKFYTFLIIQINIILHYCVLRISVSLIGGAAAHPLKPPLVSTELYAIS